MAKLSRAVGLAIMLALLVLGIFVVTVSADELSPPYVVILEPWSFDARSVAIIPADPAVPESMGYAYIVAQKGIAVFRGLSFTHAIDIGSPVNVATDPDRGLAYVTSRGNAVSVIKGTTLLTNTVNVNGVSGAVAVLTTTGYAYVALPERDEVVIISKTKELVSLEVGQRPVAIAVNPVTGYVYVANREANSISVLENLTVTATIPVGSSPTQITVDQDSGYVYVSNSGDNSVSILQNTHLVTTIDDINEPGEIAPNPVAGYVYVLSSDTTDPQNSQGWLTVLSGTQKLATEVPLMAVPKSIAVNPNSGYVYVTIGADETGAVTVLSGTVALETFPMGQTPPDVAVDPVSDLAYVPIYNGRVAIFGRTRVFATDPLGPGSGATTLYCENVQDAQTLPITITIPAGAVPTEDTRVLCIPLDDVETAPDYIWAKQGFRLAVALSNGVNPTDYTFAAPLTADMAYLASLPAKVVESELEILHREWQGTSNRWLWFGSGITKINQDMGNNHFVVQLDSTNEYGLVWAYKHIYLPLIMRQAS
ncbi:MAG: YncE family protein [Anaerolineae bacterium]|nr:YncE family protein [Anaerolineae bacterium]